MTHAEAYSAEYSTDSVPWQLFKGEQNANIGNGPLRDALRNIGAKYMSGHSFSMNTKGTTL